MKFRLLAVCAGLLCAVEALPAPSPRYELVRIESYRLGGVPESLGTEESVADAAAWLEREARVGRTEMLPPRELPLPWGDGSETEIEQLRRLLAVPPGRESLQILVVWIPRFAHGSLGRANFYGDGTALVVMNADRLARFAAADGMRARETKTLRHELVHAVGFVPLEDHLQRINGWHCSRPECLLFARVRLIDLMAYLFPNDLAAAQPKELCILCRRDLAEPQ